MAVSVVFPWPRLSSIRVCLAQRFAQRRCCPTAPMLPGRGCPTARVASDRPLPRGGRAVVQQPLVSNKS